MGSTHKTVIIRKMDRDSVSGYVGASFLRDDRIELLNSTGKVVYVPTADVKGVYFVRDLQESEELVRKTFPSRPRADGLWVRLAFKDNEVLEGLMGNDLTQLTPEGFLVTPPDTRGNTQRIWVPRSALQSLTVLAVIGGTQLKKRPARVGATQQPELFAEAE